MLQFINQLPQHHDAILLLLKFDAVLEFDMIVVGCRRVITNIILLLNVLHQGSLMFHREVLLLITLQAQQVLTLEALQCGWLGVAHMAPLEVYAECVHNCFCNI